MISGWRVPHSTYAWVAGQTSQSPPQSPFRRRNATVTATEIAVGDVGWVVERVTQGRGFYAGGSGRHGAGGVGSSASAARRVPSCMKRPGRHSTPQRQNACAPLARWSWSPYAHVQGRAPMRTTYPETRTFWGNCRGDLVRRVRAQDAQASAEYNTSPHPKRAGGATQGWGRRRGRAGNLLEWPRIPRCRANARMMSRMRLAFVYALPWIPGGGGVRPSGRHVPLRRLLDVV